MRLDHTGNDRAVNSRGQGLLLLTIDGEGTNGTRRRLSTFSLFPDHEPSYGAK
jgi:hypothetical protein